MKERKKRRSFVDWFLQKPESGVSYAFQAKVCARCTVFPDLSNAELQNDWGVAKPEELLGKLLIGGEFDDYVTEVFQLNGFKTENELVDEAKN